MAIAEVLATIDQEIAHMQQARMLLSGGVTAAPKKKAGRPKKVVATPKKAAKAAKVAPVAAKPAKKKKRHLSAEGRKRIAEAVKKRWAAQKAVVTK
jgi:hypothetical protein